MHTNCDYGVQIIPFELLNESPAAVGFLNRDGNFKKKSKRRVYIYSNEGRIPHCHYINKEKNREICVRLDKSEYFTHGGKQIKFTKDEKDIFVKFMKWIPKSYSEPTWLWCKRVWNGFAEEDDSDMESIKIENIPDYSKLETE